MAASSRFLMKIHRYLCCDAEKFRKLAPGANLREIVLGT